MPKSGKRRFKRRNNQATYILFSLIALIIFWAISLYFLLTRWRVSENYNHKVRIVERMPKPSSRVLSRLGNVTVESDVRGNLGPPSVIIQAEPGTDWIKDRWQAASDMHGTNIKGRHWLLLDFGTEIIADKIVLDFEAAYADKYKIEASILYPGKNMTETWTLFDGTDPSQEKLRQVKKSGQSPGVKFKTPLHVTHTIYPLKVQKPLRYLRLLILKSAMGWGVSLWQLDVYGVYKSETI